MSSKSDNGGSETVSVWTILYSAMFFRLTLDVDGSGAAGLFVPVTFASFLSTFLRSETDDFELTDDVSVAFLV